MQFIELLENRNADLAQAGILLLSCYDRVATEFLQLWFGQGRLTAGPVLGRWIPLYTLRGSASAGERAG